MRFIILSIGVILGTAIQSTWLSTFHLPGQVKPDLILILVISYGLLRGVYHGACFGLLAGLFMDLLSGNVIGIGALVKMTAGFSSGLLEKTIFKDNLLVPALAAFFGTLFFETFDLIMHLSFHGNYHFISAFVSIVFPQSLYNTLLAPVVYYFLLEMENMLAERAAKI
jgi:rod shape-determining protein MreD